MNALLVYQTRYIKKAQWAESVYRYFVSGNWSPTYLFMTKRLRSKYVLGLHFCILKIECSKYCKNTKQIPKKSSFQWIIRLCQSDFFIILIFLFSKQGLLINCFLEQYYSNSHSKQAFLPSKTRAIVLWLQYVSAQLLRNIWHLYKLEYSMMINALK